MAGEKCPGRIGKWIDTEAVDRAIPFWRFVWENLRRKWPRKIIPFGPLIEPLRCELRTPLYTLAIHGVICKVVGEIGCGSACAEKQK